MTEETTTRGDETGSKGVELKIYVSPTTLHTTFDISREVIMYKDQMVPTGEEFTVIDDAADFLKGLPITPKEYPFVAATVKLVDNSYVAVSLLPEGRNQIRFLQIKEREEMKQLLN